MERGGGGEYSAPGGYMLPQGVERLPGTPSTRVVYKPPLEQPEFEGLSSVTREVWEGLFRLFQVSGFPGVTPELGPDPAAGLAYLLAMETVGAAVALRELGELGLVEVRDDRRLWVPDFAEMQAAGAASRARSERG